MDDERDPSVFPLDLRDIGRWYQLRLWGLISWPEELAGN